MPASPSQGSDGQQSQPILQEIKTKQQQLVSLMAESKLDGLLLRRHENVSWATAGQVDMRVAIPMETGAAAVFVRKDGKSFYLTTNNEAPRLGAEEFAGLPFEAVALPWHSADFAAAAAELTGGGTIGSDTPDGNHTPINLAGLRAQLQASEIERYRWLGATTGRVVEEVIHHLEPGVSEEEMSALTASLLIQRAILPSVLLMAVDDRIRNYKHALPRGGRLERFGMVNLCARKWGLVVSITRFVHFGPMPQALADGFTGAAKVNAALLHATRAGSTSQQLFIVAKQAYADAGFAGAEELHHQGGATGYGEREWVATPQGTEVVVDRQAFAWNPSAQGGKVEDTTLLQDGKIEILTPTTGLPQVVTTMDGENYGSTDVLIR